MIKFTNDGMQSGDDLDDRDEIQRSMRSITATDSISMMYSDVIQRSMRSISATDSIPKHIGYYVTRSRKLR